MKTQTLVLPAIAGILLSGCANHPHQVQSIDPEFRQYEAQFEREAAKRQIYADASHLQMYFVTVLPNPGELASCNMDMENPTIVVLSSAWASFDNPSDREQLIFHELGHCLLGLIHTLATEISVNYLGLIEASTTLPSSIMTPYHMSVYTYSQNRDEYVAREFLGNNSEGGTLYWDAPVFDFKIYSN